MDWPDDQEQAVVVRALYLVPMSNHGTAAGSLHYLGR